MSTKIEHRELYAVAELFCILTAAGYMNLYVLTFIQSPFTCMTIFFFKAKLFQHLEIFSYTMWIKLKSIPKLKSKKI